MSLEVAYKSTGSQRWRCWDDHPGTSYTLGVLEKNADPAAQRSINCGPPTFFLIGRNHLAALLPPVAHLKVASGLERPVKPAEHHKLCPHEEAS